MRNAPGCALRLLVFFAFALWPATSSAQRTPVDQWASVRDTVRELMTRTNAPSVSIAVARGGKIVWEEAFGLADREKMIPATPNTMYSLASISKPMTATGMMTLVERGAIDLDRPANDYLGVGKLTGLAGDAKGATVRRVMSHTAGLPLHYQFYYANEPYPVVSNDETIARYGILVTPPGEIYEYSNLGYGIVDHILSRVSGAPYADYMRNNVFLPLGLTRTSVGIGPGLEAYVAQRYDPKQRPIPFYDFDHRGGSAVYASAHDLVRFGMFHLKDHLPDQRPILKDATIDEMHRAVAPANYGLGWIITEREGQRIVSHTGGMPGVQTILALYPAEDVAIVVLTNMSAGEVGRPFREIERIVLPKYAEVRRRLAQTTPASSSGAAPPKPFVPPGELLGEWSGTVRTWEGTIPIKLVAQPDGDVHVRLGGGLESLLNDVRWQDSTLVGRFAGAVATSDAARWPHDVLVSLRLRKGALNGMVSALQVAEPVHFALTSYATLTRDSTSRPRPAR
jgi:CubicO group peptidase (beta-lactamase class C family)